MPQEEVIKDRRVSQRVPVKFAVEMKDLAYVYRGEAADLSAGGMKVRLSEELSEGQELELTLRPEGEVPVNLKGKVAHLRPGAVGIAFSTKRLEDFEAALNLFEGLVFRQPALAIRLKQRPSTMPVKQRIYPLPLKGAQLTGPEHWVYGLLNVGGTMVFDLRRTLSGEWDRLAWVPFALVERGVATLTPPQQGTWGG